MEETVQIEQKWLAVKGVKIQTLPCEPPMGKSILV